MAGMQSKSPAPARSVAKHHSTDGPIKIIPPAVVDTSVNPHARTMASGPEALPSPDSILRQLKEQSNPAVILDMPKKVRHTAIERKNGNGNTPKKDDTPTVPAQANGKNENGGQNKYDVEYTSEDIPGIQIFGTHASVIKNDIVIANKPALRNRGAEFYKIKLECVDNKISLVSIEPEEVREVIETPIRLFLKSRGEHIGSDLSDFRSSYTFAMQLTYPTRDFSGEEIKAPVMRATPHDGALDTANRAEDSRGTKITPVYGIDLGNPYKLPDKNGYVLFVDEKEYHVRLANETDFSYQFRLTKRAKGDKELVVVGNFTFDKSKKEEHAGFSDEKMWITLTRHKNGERSIAIINWDPYAGQASDQSKNRAPRTVTAIVTVASAATLFFLPEITDSLRQHFHLIKLPESVDLASLGSIPLRAYLSMAAGSIMASGLLILNLMGRIKKGDTQ